MRRRSASRVTCFISAFERVLIVALCPQRSPKTKSVRCTRILSPTLGSNDAANVHGTS
jgi:hypothetical protein